MNEIADRKTRSDAQLACRDDNGNPLPPITITSYKYAKEHPTMKKVLKYNVGWKFETLEELRTEVERLASGEVKTLGDWSLAQLFKHLAAGFNSVVDGSSFKAPWFFKLMAPFMKKKFLCGEIPSGFSIPKEAEAQFLPSGDADTQAAKDELLAAISRVDSASDSDLAPHPMFGELSKALFAFS